MNIFLLDLDPTKAAQAHVDKHVVKMILEACQLLYTAHWVIHYPHLLEYRAPSKLAIVQKFLPVPPTLDTAPPVSVALMNLDFVRAISIIPVLSGFARLFKIIYF